jgi:hypothetical protein
MPLKQRTHHRLIAGIGHHPLEIGRCPHGGQIFQMSGSQIVHANHL